MSRLQEILRQFKEKRVVVFGDLVADIFIYGEISRISREAPVLILNHRETQLVPGGGANAIHNLRALGAQPIPVGVVGADAEGRQLLEFFHKLGIDTAGIRVAGSYRTPAKTRIVAGAGDSQRQQIVRMDYGAPIKDEKLRRAVSQGLKLSVSKADGLLVSDYGYGLITPETVASLQRLPVFTAPVFPPQ